MATFNSLDLRDFYQKQLALQRALGYDFTTMDDEQKMSYIRQCTMALVSEACEALAETGWKPWASSNHINRSRYADELVDAFHFLLNLFIVAGILPYEIRERFEAKNTENHRRNLEGYTGREAKCKNCDAPVPTHWIAVPPISPDLARRNTDGSGLVWCSDSCYDLWHRKMTEKA